LRKDFYRGVGAGFAETLCRFWRKLLPPQPDRNDFYTRGLEIEWQRCILLITTMPMDIRSIVFEGLRKELHKRELNTSIKKFIRDADSLNSY
jgi:hypothetical protein